MTHSTALPIPETMLKTVDQENAKAWSGEIDHRIVADDREKQETVDFQTALHNIPQPS